MPPGLGGDAWAFLYAPDAGPPGVPAVPLEVTGVSAVRLAASPRYLFAAVPPDPYRLWGLLDVDGNFDPTIDVLAQPTRGDRVTSRGLELEVQPGRGAIADLVLDREVRGDPPAFHLDTPGADLALDAPAGQLTSVTLVSDPLGRFSSGFEVGLVDANGDGLPDDANGDGLPDLSLTAFFHWLPAGGQRADGEIVLPLLYNPAPFLTLLQNQVGATIIADRLQAVVLGAVQVASDGTVSTLSAPPVGRYELVVLLPGGQFWRVPNQLGPAIASQNVQLHVDRR